MNIIGRARPPEPPQPSADDVTIATLTARHDQALALIDQLVGAGRTTSPGKLVDGLLDLRNILQPPKEPAR